MSPEALEKQVASAGGSTEAFPLSDSVRIYIDEVGALKRLPINMRAAMLAERCGCVPSMTCTSGRRG